MKPAMSPLANRLVAKMNGLGNEILVLDLRGAGLSVSAAEARAIARTKNLAFDQLMALHEPRTPGTEAFVRIFNADGSEAGACGNGTRCVAWTLLRDDPRNEIVIETARGPSRLPAHSANGAFRSRWARRASTGATSRWRGPWPTRARSIFPIGPPDAPILRNPAVVNMGNPHAIFFVDDIGAYDLAAIGPALEHDPIFPERANISLAHVVAGDHIELKVWERGVGLTRACGSAACAALVAAARRGLTGRSARVSLPGGDLDILWRESDGMVVMTGPVAFEFETRLDPALFADIAA